MIPKDNLILKLLGLIALIIIIGVAVGIGSGHYRKYVVDNEEKTMITGIEE